MPSKPIPFQKTADDQSTRHPLSNILDSYAAEKAVKLERHARIGKIFRVCMLVYLFGAGCVADEIYEDTIRAPGIPKGDFIGLASRAIFLWPVLALDDVVASYVYSHLEGAVCMGISKDICAHAPAGFSGSLILVPAMPAPPAPRPLDGDATRNT